MFTAAPLQHGTPDTEEIRFVEEPARTYLMVDGSGPATGAAYDHALAALLAVTYGCRCALTPPRETSELPVMHAELLRPAPGGDGTWTAMVRQTDGLTPELVAQISDAVPVPMAKHVRLERFSEGPCVQVLHRGLLAHSGEAVTRLEAFIADHGYVPTGRRHEIYLTDPRRCVPDQGRTLIRQPVVRRAPAAEAGVRTREPFPRFIAGQRAG